MPRFVALVKASPESEAGALPSTEMLEEMTRYNEELVKAGVMLAGEGLHPTSAGARIAYEGSESRTVTTGPFPEPKDLVAGYWVLKARDLTDAVDWLKRAPFRDGEVEIRQIFEDDDFGDALTPDLREAEDRMRKQAAQNR